jgi:hypothetical protein
MNLTKMLRKQGYDLIDGPIRNQKLLQLWVKTPANGVDVYFSNIRDAFVSEVALVEVQNTSLSIDSTKKDEYGFNIGVSILEEVMESLGLGDLGIEAEIKSGKKISISYDNSITKEVPIGEVQNYLASSDFKYPNVALLRNANRDNILIVVGVLFAKNLVVEIETDFNLDAELVLKLNEVAGGKLDFSKKSESKLKMVSSGSDYFPVAVKAHRIDYDNGVFRNTKLVTRKRKIF